MTKPGPSTCRPRKRVCAAVALVAGALISGCGGGATTGGADAARRDAPIPTDDAVSALREAERQQLERLFVALSRREFPRDTADDDLGLLFTDLAIYDGELAGLVSRLVAGEKIPRRYLPHLRRRDDLERALGRFATSDDAEVAGAARAYLDYLWDLHRIVDVAKAVAVRDR